MKKIKYFMFQLNSDTSVSCRTEKGMKFKLNGAKK